jgi:hypothetical protein
MVFPYRGLQISRFMHSTFDMPDTKRHVDRVMSIYCRVGPCSYHPGSTIEPWDYTQTPCLVYIDVVEHGTHTALKIAGLDWVCLIVH